MKKVLLFACTLIIAGSLFANKTDVTEKVLKTFKQTFTQAEDVVWSDNENIYMVKFTQQGIRTSVKFDEEGNFISSLRYYLSDQLPVDIQCKLKKKFPGQEIFGVTENIVGDDVNYYVKLEDEKTWTTVKIDNYRNMQITEKYKKAK
jgi:Putative beta-lactamase-inhibitor-like, PepSY-like